MTPSLRTLISVFGRIGLLSFGGPAAQISLMHSELVDKKRWLTEEQFLGALSFCMLLPGPEAMQLATYSGWRLRGTLGGLIAGLLFVVPGALVILILALGYAYYGQLPIVQAVFTGVKAAVIAIVLRALISLSYKALNGWDAWALALIGFAAMFFLSVPFPILIAAAAFWGYIRTRDQIVTPHHERLPRLSETALRISLWVALWAAPVIAAISLNSDFLRDIALFFSTLAVVTFGGAYAVLAYMTQAVVETHGWLTTAQMIDALGLAETTPGPLILVTEFVGFLAGFERGGLGLALLAGAMTLWVTFIPCFLWIFAGAPYVEALLARPRLKGALASISAMVVGVILNLSLWFALYVLFEDVRTSSLGPRPILQSFEWLNAGFVGLAILFLIGFKWSVVQVLMVMGVLAVGSYVLL